MLFSALAKETPSLGFLGMDREVRSLSLDTRALGDEPLFFCIRGVKTDRHTLAPEAYRRGCRAFVAEESLPLPPDASVLLVPNARLSLADLAAAFYGHPAETLSVTGVTGTKGKTTTAWFLLLLLEAAGRRAGYIGSLGAYCCGKWVKTSHTTPESLELQRLMAEMRECGVTHLVLEVSSQSLLVGRVRGLRFPYAILTGLGYDHIGEGEHCCLPDYFAAKRELFRFYHTDRLFYSNDDPLSRRLIAPLSIKKSTVGLTRENEVTAHSPTLFKENGIFGQRFDLVTRDGAFPVTLALPGVFNIRNALLAVAAAQAILQKEGQKMPLSFFAEVLRSARVPGHFEVLPLLADRSFIIDYAHNGQSMAALIALLRAYRPTRLTLLFGSVGGRSYARRGELGCVAKEADRVILTSDDPGAEDPTAIAAEIQATLGHTEHIFIADRAEAVRHAISTSIGGEILAFCGKGAEKTQLVGHKRHPYSEEEAIRSAVREFFPKKNAKQPNFF